MIRAPMTWLWPRYDTEYIKDAQWAPTIITWSNITLYHDDVIKWKHFPCYWPFVRGIHRSPVNSTHKGQWLGASIFSLICCWIKSWVNNREADDLRRYRAHYDVIVTSQNGPMPNTGNKYGLELTKTQTHGNVFTLLALCEEKLRIISDFVHK